MKLYFVSMILLLIPFYLLSQEKEDKNIKITALLSYTQEETENFPTLKEKKYKGVNSLQISCQDDYNCGYQIKDQQLSVHQYFDPREPPNMDEEEQTRMADYKKRYVDEFILHYYFRFEKEGMNLIYGYISKGINRQISSQAVERTNDNRSRHRLETYVLEDSIMNLFPKKIRVIDYIHLNELKGYTFVILAKPKHWMFTFTEPDYEIYLALVKNKNQFAKLIFLKKEDQGILFSDSSIFGLEEKLMNGNRVVLFHVATYLISGPIVLHDLHLVWLGKY